MTRHFFFTAMLFVYGRILSQRLVNTVTPDKVLFKLVTSLIKYHMVICYFLYIAGWLYKDYLCSLCSGMLFEDFWLIKYLLWMISDIYFCVIGLRFCVVHCDIKEKDVQVSIWSVCLDAYDSDRGVHSIILHCGQYFWRNILVTWFDTWLIYSLPTYMFCGFF